MTLIGVYPTTEIKTDADGKVIPQPGVLVRYLVQRPASTTLIFGGERLFDGNHRLRPPEGIAGGRSSTWPYDWMDDQQGVRLPEIEPNEKTRIVVRERFFRGIQISSSRDPTSHSRWQREGSI